MKTLGKLTRIKDLRSIWKHEAKEFTPWLAEEENLARLSEEIGIDLVLEEQESNVGDFSVDIYAKEEVTGRRVIIENQLEDTNHDHLGKVITYAAGKEAEVIIWIVKRAREEHQKAIEWLNEHTDDKCDFFLIEIELWQIGDSDPAVKFNIIERPNNWAKSQKKDKDPDPRYASRLDFWQSFIDYNQTTGGFYAKSKPTTDAWIGKGSRGIPSTSISLVVARGNCRIELYTNSGSKAKNREIYYTLEEHKEDIEKVYGRPLRWSCDDSKVTCKIYEERALNYANLDDRQEIFEFFIDATDRMYKAIAGQVKYFKK